MRIFEPVLKFKLGDGPEPAWRCTTTVIATRALIFVS